MPDVQLESGIGSRGRVYIQLVMLDHRVCPDSRKMASEEGRQDWKVVWVFWSHWVDGGGCVMDMVIVSDS